MKILIYIELHPIRDRFESFSFIAKKFVDMLRDEYLGALKTSLDPYDIRILIGRHYGGVLSSNEDMKSIFLGLTKDENDKIESYKRSWSDDPEAIRQWKDLMKGEGEVSTFYSSILERVHENVFPFDVLINWSTNGAVRGFCERRGIDNVSLELGCTRAPIYDSAYVDALGVNGASIAKHVDLNMISTSDMHSIRARLPMTGLHDSEWDGLNNPILSKHAYEIYRNPERNVLIPLQLKDDSNCILYSSYHSMEDFLKEVLPRLVEKGYRCFVKPHPAASDRKINKDDHEKCRELVDAYSDQVFWLDDINHRRDYVSLLNKVKYVVTVNSSTGFEAMLCGRVAIVMGDAPYKIGSDYPSFEDMLSGALCLMKYRELSGKIVGVFLRHYLVPRDFLFRYKYFVEYVFDAIQAKNAYLRYGSAALTECISKNNYLNYNIKNILLNKSGIRSRFAEVSRNAVAAKGFIESAGVHVGKNGRVTKRPKFSWNQKKWVKFRRDPAKFFVDSKSSIFRRIGLIMGGRP